MRARGAHSAPDPASAEAPHGTAPLRLRGREVAAYVWQPSLPRSASPRPYLHPVRTLGGLTVTDRTPASHPHQLGISVATPDLDGHNFWGGRTYVAGHGPAWLDNHGTQRHQRWLHRTGTELVHDLCWLDAHGRTLLRERRTIGCRPAGATAWALDVRTRLTNATDRPLAFRTPAALGRAGAGFGGVFWRGPAVAAAHVLSPDGPGVPAAHGRPAAWVAVGGTSPGPDGASWTMLFTAGDDVTARDRWFVRARDYVGVGSSLAWDRPLTLPAGESLARHVVVVVADGLLSPATAAGLARAAGRAP
ncbi:oxidoreductase [Nonomuraea sp. MG754425]|uniref:DUF6807 domain-containing protein n=1 Tax=Nonomuraea sp. MG754425 TaxID=2570319 RepID=UPI001F41CA7A|nr:PmoA family protein [Nonomuraea sp. MG754425]MCF6473509.1 oxidoreductase [Nonomuraea sp. MG754425]